VVGAGLVFALERHLCINVVIEEDVLDCAHEAEGDHPLPHRTVERIDAPGRLDLAHRISQSLALLSIRCLLLGLVFRNLHLAAILALQRWRASFLGRW
jgi:hypothetical protein